MGTVRDRRAHHRERASRMTDSKSGSKDNLNESNMPLLESEEKAEETPEKEVVEMELEEKEEKKDEVTEKDKMEEKKKKEKKVKVPKVKKEPGPSCIDTLSSGLVFYVWIIRPVMRIVETLLAIFRRFWVVLLNATLAPVCDAVGGIFKAAPRLVQSA